MAALPGRFFDVLNWDPVVEQRFAGNLHAVGWANQDEALALSCRALVQEDSLHRVFGGLHAKALRLRLRAQQPRVLSAARDAVQRQSRGKGLDVGLEMRVVVLAREGITL